MTMIEAKEVRMSRTLVRFMTERNPLEELGDPPLTIDTTIYSDSFPWKDSAENTLLL